MVSSRHEGYNWGGGIAIGISRTDHYDLRKHLQRIGVQQVQSRARFADMPTKPHYAPYTTTMELITEDKNSENILPPYIPIQSCKISGRKNMT